MSILQGGPAFPVLSLPLYEYLCTRQFDKGLTISDEDVPIADVYRLLKQVYIYLLHLFLKIKEIHQGDKEFGQNVL